MRVRTSFAGSQPLAVAGSRYPKRHQASRGPRHSYAFLSGSRAGALSKAKATCKARAGPREIACAPMQPHGLRHADVSATCPATVAQKARWLNAIHRRCNSCAPAAGVSLRLPPNQRCSTRVATMSSGNGRAFLINARFPKLAQHHVPTCAAANDGAHSRNTPPSRSQPTPQRRSK